MINFTKYRKIYYILSGLLVVLSLFSILSYGVKLGIDFTGGSVLELKFQQRPDNAAIQEKLKELNLGEIVIQPTENEGVIMKMKSINQEEHQKIVSELNGISPVTELRFESIGPVIGRELSQKTNAVLFLSLIAMVFYIAVAFRGVSWLISSWQLSFASLIALFHNIIIPVGVFSFLGKFYNIEITIPFIVAILTIIGYSINDTVVVFDRIREHLLKKTGEAFDKVVDKSLNEVFGRSVNTVLTVLITLFAIFFFGGDSLKYFSLALIIGIAAGAYSSIFIASSLLVTWFPRERKK